MLTPRQPTVTSTVTDPKPSSPLETKRVDIRELKVIQSKRLRASFWTKKRRWIAVGIIGACVTGILLATSILVPTLLTRQAPEAANIIVPTNISVAIVSTTTTPMDTSTTSTASSKKASTPTTSPCCSTS